MKWAEMRRLPAAAMIDEGFLNGIRARMDEHAPAEYDVLEDETITVSKEYDDATGSEYYVHALIRTYRKSS